MSTGRCLLPNGVMQCSSIALEAGEHLAGILPAPSAIVVERPIAESIE
ncbi:MAG: hypothetical protein U0792_14310 [Gemmataceae bacterium]